MPRRFDIRVCRGPVCGGERDAGAVHARLAALIRARDLDDAVGLDWQICFGRCRHGVNVHVRDRLDRDGPEAPRQRLSALYSGVRAGDADELLSAHVCGGRVVERLVHRPAAGPLPAQQPVLARAEQPEPGEPSESEGDRCRDAAQDTR